ncbi:hypothetical protein, partial [Microcoleus sp. herbarium13]|uniref:hypothetical protein n=1 Tax=Microcoleus sp. herbarium13 TaxID=3055438 RepID=UPI002FD02152
MSRSNAVIARFSVKVDREFLEKRVGQLRFSINQGQVEKLCRFLGENEKIFGEKAGFSGLYCVTARRNDRKLGFFPDAGWSETNTVQIRPIPPSPP